MLDTSSSPAFARNLGWITSGEAQYLSNVTVAIAGVGGVGGHYCEVMARLGVQNFHLADPDTFEIANFNRQNGSGFSALGQPKLDVLSRRILDINPQAKITRFPDGVNDENRRRFLSNTDLYLDGLDYFAFDERIKIFALARELRIPAITVAPIGSGAAALVFDDHSMSFSDYFGMHVQQSESEKSSRFLLGLAPSLQHIKYMADRSYVNFADHRVPSLPFGCYLAGGVAGSLALKILLKRGKVLRAPWSLHYDAYLNSYKKKYVWLGFRNPVQRIKLLIIQNILAKTQIKK
nr:hypothetical protein HAGR004_41180 [Bdellovibrio sp. HAGR004]